MVIVKLVVQQFNSKVLILNLNHPMRSESHSKVFVWNVPSTWSWSLQSAAGNSERFVNKTETASDGASLQGRLDFLEKLHVVRLKLRKRCSIFSRCATYFYQKTKKGSTWVSFSSSLQLSAVWVEKHTHHIHEWKEQSTFTFLVL